MFRVWLQILCFKFLCYVLTNKFKSSVKVENDTLYIVGTPVFNHHYISGYHSLDNEENLNAMKTSSCV